MSFFLGLAEGVEAGLQKRERDEEREAQQARYDEQRAWTRQMHAYRVKQDRLTSERQAQKDALDAEDRKRRIELEDQALQTADEELRLKRIETFLPYMNNPSLASALGGSGSKAGLSPMSPATIAKGSIDFKFHFDELPTDTKKDPFFQALSKSPEGQAAVIAFMSAQAAESNTVPLQDMPKYFKYLGATEGQNEQEAAAFLKSITEGDADITDTDTFIKGLLTLNSYKPVKHVFAQIDAPISASDINTQYEGWVGAIKSEAEREILSLENGSERKTKIEAALSQASQSATEIRGLANLASLGFGRDLLESQGYIDNYRITSFYETEGEPEPTSTTPPPGAPSGVTIYNNWDEVSKAREKGSLGNFMVTGDNTIYEDQEEKNSAPVIAGTPPTAPATPVGAGKDDEFISFKRGESSGPQTRGGRAKFEKSGIDAMFGDALDPPDFGDTKPKRPSKPFVDTRSADEIIEDNITDIKKVVDKGKSDEEVAEAVKKNLLEAGIEWPTNKDELGWFRDDLKDAVREFGMDVPKEALQIVVDEAVNNVLPKKFGTPSGRLDDKGTTPSRSISIEDWEAMSVKGREALGLPTSRAGIQQIVRGGRIPVGPVGNEAPETMDYAPAGMASNYQEDGTESSPMAMRADAQARTQYEDEVYDMTQVKQEVDDILREMSEMPKEELAFFVEKPEGERLVDRILNSRGLDGKGMTIKEKLRMIGLYPYNK